MCKVYPWDWSGVCVSRAVQKTAVLGAQRGPRVPSERGGLAGTLLQALSLQDRERTRRHSGDRPARPSLQQLWEVGTVTERWLLSWCGPCLLSLLLEEAAARLGRPLWRETGRWPLVNSLQGMEALSPASLEDCGILPEHMSVSGGAFFPSRAFS